MSQCLKSGVKIAMACREAAENKGFLAVFLVFALMRIQ